MPKVYFGKRGGAYVMRNGNKKYLSQFGMEQPESPRPIAQGKILQTNELSFEEHWNRAYNASEDTAKKVFITVSKRANIVRDNSPNYKTLWLRIFHKHSQDEDYKKELTRKLNTSGITWTSSFGKKSKFGMDPATPPQSSRTIWSPAAMRDDQITIYDRGGNDNMTYLFDKLVEKDPAKAEEFGKANLRLFQGAPVGSVNRTLFDEYWVHPFGGNIGWIGASGSWQGYTVATKWTTFSNAERWQRFFKWLIKRKYPLQNISAPADPRLVEALVNVKVWDQIYPEDLIDRLNVVRFGMEPGSPRRNNGARYLRTIEELKESQAKEKLTQLLKANLPNQINIKMYSAFMKVLEGTMSKLEGQFLEDALSLTRTFKGKSIMFIQFLYKDGIRLYTEQVANGTEQIKVLENYLTELYVLPPTTPNKSRFGKRLLRR
jgi:hypothetical protein